MLESTPPKRQWKPLLEGAQAQAAMASVNEIAAALRVRLEGQEHTVGNPYLGEGAAGIAIFYTYLHAAGFRGMRDLALQYLNLSADALAAQVMGPSFFAGFSGVAWAVQHVASLLDDLADDSNVEIDLALETYLDHQPWEYDYDLVNGLAGLGAYCLERRYSSVAKRCLELIVERLDELAEQSQGGLRWLTAPDLLPATQREVYPRGHYNLGLAHGIPGIIALLARIHSTGIARDKTGRLLEGALNWFLQQRLSDTGNSSFAAFLGPEKTSEGCRLAWCYGDAGAAAALFVAARCAGMEPWEDATLEIARHAALRDAQSCGVVDACFCHGSSGLAHIFNRFYHASGDELFAHAARFWMQKILEFRNPSAGAAGYSFWGANDAGQMEFQPRFGLIEGIAGIGLTLLAAISNLEPRWDRAFMVDIPPKAHA